MGSDANQSALRLALTRRNRTSGTTPVSPVDSSDEELVLHMERGDRFAVEELFDRYSTLVFGIGLRILRSRSEAEDFVQDLFLRLVEKLKGFDPAKGSGRTWIVHIAYRQVFDRRTYLQKRCFYDGTDVERIQNTIN